MYSKNKNIKNTFLTKRYFATYVAFSSSIKIELLILPSNKAPICKY